MFAGQNKIALKHHNFTTLLANTLPPSLLETFPIQLLNLRCVALEKVILQSLFLQPPFFLF